MKKRIAIAGILLALLSLWIGPKITRASVSCSVPFTFVNGTTADATQVNSNFTAIIACLGNAAAAGVNSDITQLTGLTTPLAPASGGAAVFIGGTTGGGANAQTLTTTTPNSFTLTTGYRVTFIAGGGLTNTAALTLNVASTGAKNVFRKTQLGATLTEGGEVIAGNPYTVVYDGTEFILDGETVEVGKISDYGGSIANAPAYALIANGGCVSRTTYPDLFTVIGTSFDPTSICDVAHFRLPNLGGTLTAGPDTGSIISTACAANSILPASSANSATVGNACGKQNQVIAQANLPASISSVTNAVTVPSGQGSHTHNLSNSGDGVAGLTGSPGAPSLQSASSTNGVRDDSIAAATLPAMNGNLTSLGGSGTALSTLPPVLIVTKIIRF